MESERCGCPEDVEVEQELKIGKSLVSLLKDTLESICRGAVDHHLSSWGLPELVNLKKVAKLHHLLRKAGLLEQIENAELVQDRETMETMLLWLRWSKCAYENTRKDISDRLGIELDRVYMHNMQERLDVSRPSYFLAIWPEGSSIILCIRGTQTYSDVLTDLTLHGAPFNANNFSGYAHAGFLASATWILSQEEKNLRFLRNKFKDYKLIITGHSLGGGTAAVLSLLLHDLDLETLKKLKNKDAQHDSIPEDEQEQGQENNKEAVSESQEKNQDDSAIIIESKAESGISNGIEPKDVEDQDEDEESNHGGPLNEKKHNEEDNVNDNSDEVLFEPECWTYGCPPCVDLTLCEYASFIHNVVLQDDFVTRASARAIEELRKEMIDTSWDEVLEDGDKRKDMLKFLKKCLTSTRDFKLSNGLTLGQVMNESRDQFRKLVAPIAHQILHAHDGEFGPVAEFATNFIMGTASFFGYRPKIEDFPLEDEKYKRLKSPQLVRQKTTIDVLEHRRLLMPGHIYHVVRTRIDETLKPIQTPNDLRNWKSTNRTYSEVMFWDEFEDQDFEHDEDVDNEEGRVDGVETDGEGGIDGVDVDGDGKAPEKLKGKDMACNQVYLHHSKGGLKLFDSLDVDNDDYSSGEEDAEQDGKISSDVADSKTTPEMNPGQTEQASLKPKLSISSISRNSSCSVVKSQSVTYIMGKNNKKKYVKYSVLKGSYLGPRLKRIVLSDRMFTDHFCLPYAQGIIAAMCWLDA